MDYTIDELLQKLNIIQLKDLINLYGLEKPHSRSSKSDIISYIKASNILLDPRMLINYFSLKLKTKNSSEIDIITNNIKDIISSDDIVKVKKLPKLKIDTTKESASVIPLKAPRHSRHSRHSKHFDDNTIINPNNENTKNNN